MRTASCCAEGSVKALCIALLTLCGLFAGNADAAHWVKVVDSKTSRIYVDTDSINRIGDIVSAWYKRDFSHPIASGKSHQRYQSSKVLNYYNCADREIAHARWITFANREASGKPLSSEEVDSLQYGDVTADDTGEPIFNFVCTYRK